MVRLIVVTVNRLLCEIDGSMDCRTQVVIERSVGKYFVDHVYRRNDFGKQRRITREELSGIIEDLYFANLINQLADR